MTTTGKTPAQPAWMMHAWRELGQREVAGRGANARIRALYREAGHPQIVSDEVPWCAAFVGASLERAGLTGTGSLLARSYLGWGETIASPRLGCVAVFSRGADPGAGHVGFWVGETDGAILLLGGNQDDAVDVDAVPRSRLLGYRWPSPPAEHQGSDAAHPPETSAAAHVDDDDAFDAALLHVLQVEGGYSDDPYDPGGPTNKGITLADYARYRRQPADGPGRERLIAELKAIPDTQVRSIYHDFYWRPSRAGALPPALALMHFDAAVNHGLGGAARLLQAAVEADVDGEIGPLTLAAANRIPVAAALDSYAALRRDRYRALPHFWRFGRGWLNRVDIALRHARALIGQTPRPPLPTVIEQGEATMTTASTSPTSTYPPAPTEPVQPQQPVKWWGQSMTIWGVIVTGLSTVLPVIAPQLGLDITPEMVRQIGEQTLSTAQAIAGLVGLLLTVYGRLRASKPLGRRELRINV